MQTLWTDPILFFVSILVVVGIVLLFVGMTTNSRSALAAGGILAILAILVLFLRFAFSARTPQTPATDKTSPSLNGSVEVTP